MRLFHISEEDNIQIFEPRIPDRDDLDKKVGLIWAIAEERLPNFLTPRNCPRVTYHIGQNTSELDKEKFFTSTTLSYAVVIESDWFEKMKTTTLYYTNLMRTILNSKTMLLATILQRQHKYQRLSMS